MGQERLQIDIVFEEKAILSWFRDFYTFYKMNGRAMVWSMGAGVVSYTHKYITLTSP